MVVAIVFLGVIGSVITALIKAIGERRERSDDSAGEAEELRDHIVTLEERIQVLERIITDSSGREDLRRQFRDLER
jgi:hypothetical protein